MAGLRKQTARGAKWLLAESITEKVLQTGTTVILARLLEPADFGLFALAFVAMRGMDLFRNMGLDDALIQRKENIEEAANTAFCIMPVMGIFIFIVLNAIAPFLAKFFNNMQLEPIIRIMGLVFVFGTITRIPSALMEKSMQFGKLAVIDISTTLIFTLCAVLLAFAGHGVFSLVIAYVLKMFFKMILTFIVAKWRPALILNKKIALEMLHFGKYRFGAAVLYFFRRNTDNIMIGKYLGAVSLGYYAVAFNMSDLLSRYLMARINKVLFPAFSTIQDNIKSLKAAYLKTLSFLSLISLPFAAFVFIFAYDIIHIVYGEKWSPAIPILKILAIAGSFQVMSSLAVPVILARGKSKESFGLSLLTIISFIVVVIPATIYFQLRGAAYSLLFVGFLGFCVGTAYINKLLVVSVAETMKQLRLAAICTLAMVGAVLIFRYFKIDSTFAHKQQILLFVIQTLIGIISFIITMILMDRKRFKEIKDMVFS